MCRTVVPFQADGPSCPIETALSPEPERDYERKSADSDGCNSTRSMSQLKLGQTRSRRSAQTKNMTSQVVALVRPKLRIHAPGVLQFDDDDGMKSFGTADTGGH